MKAYKIITGTSQSLEDFEQKVAVALEEGYVLGGDLIAHSQGAALHLYQSVVLPEDDFEDDEDDEEDDAWEDEDEETDL